MMKSLLRKLIRTEKGQALPMVLILMAVGGLIIVPLLSYTSSGLKVGKAYERMADEYYAADAGIEDGLWQIKYNNLEELFSNYERYNYDAEYNYPLSYPVEVNDIDVDITIENVWIPLGIAAPDNDEAEALIGAGKLIIAGGVPAELTQQVRIYYYKGETDPPLLVNKIGVWLPPGFSYNEEGVCTLETWLTASNKAYTRNITPHKGGWAVIWTLDEPLPFTALPGVIPSDTPMTSVFTFNFLPDDPESERSPEAVSWITTTGVADIPYTWDADIRAFHINSVAKADGGGDGTTIDAYAIKSDLRQLVSGRNGDYRAIGNTLMENRNPDWGAPVRDYLLPDSDALANDIPDNAQVESAFLYWSAWITGASSQVIWGPEECPNFTAPIMDWDRSSSSRWTIPLYNQQFQGQGGGTSDAQRTLTMHSSIDLSAYAGQEVTISWNQTKGGYYGWSSNDYFYYAFYNGSWSGNFVAFRGDSTPTNPLSVTIPQEYLTSDFKMRFYFNFTSTYKYVYVDNIKISVQSETIADTEIRFEIDHDQVYLADDEHGNPTVPTEGAQSIYANKWTALENEGSGGYSYSCKADVTALVQTFTEQGNATYTVGDVYGDINSQWSYAGWSLIIIYSSPETQRHQLYLFDDFLYIAPNTEGISFPISGFLVPDPITDPDTGEIIEETAATITCFVGDGDDFYSGDFIAINAPEVPGYQIANSYKLWDGVTLSAPTWPPRMPNNESSPNNVWNGRSEGLGGSFIDGVDIDTFDVPWGDPLSSGLLKPGDSSATIVLNYADPNPSYAELINFIYIIIAFRSSTVTGGTVTYLIEG